MPVMGSFGEILIYTELLSNIRQVSVIASLPTPVDASTRASVSNDGHQLLIVHQANTECISLPAQVKVGGSLPVSINGNVDLTWRLPVASEQTRPGQFALENQALPWTAIDMKKGSPIQCRQCDSLFVPENAIPVWKDLPSENWAEMMEFWHCHKPHDHEHGNGDANLLASKGYGANSAIASQQGIGFVDLTSFLFSEADCKGLTYSSSTLNAGFDVASLALNDAESNKFLHVFCRKCETGVGLYNVMSSSVTLFKWQVVCQTAVPSPRPSGPECLAATLMATISRSGSSKSVITPHALNSTSSNAVGPEQNLYLWVLNPNVRYSSSRVRGSKTSIKILYKSITAEEGLGLIESMTSDVQEITLPVDAISATETELKSSTLLLPARERKFKEWDVGLLGRWESGQKEL